MKLHEYQQAVKRTCATSDPHETIKLALVGLQDELGDVLWYLTTLCTALDIFLEQVLEGNIEKVRQRYPDGFSCQRSLHRTSECAGASVADAQALAALRGSLWQATNDALLFCWDTPLSREDVTHLGLQLGRLLRVLARRFISPLDETTLAPPQEV